jgi:hypothetical protein
LSSDHIIDTNWISNLKGPKLEEFGPQFDVFDYAEKNGRENLLLSVSQPIFKYKNINKYIDFYKFPEFINQIRGGYTSSPDAFYHTVKTTFNFLFIFSKLIFLYKKSN